MCQIVISNQTMQRRIAVLVLQIHIAVILQKQFGYLLMLPDLNDLN